METEKPVTAMPKTEKANPRFFYSFIAVCAVVSASVLAVGVYTGFFDELNSDVTVQPSEVTTQENVTAPIDERVKAEEMPTHDGITN